MELRFDQWQLNDLATAPFFHAIVTHGTSLQVPDRTPEEYARYKRLYAHGNPAAILLEPYLTFSGGGYHRASFGNKNGPQPLAYAKTIQRCAVIMLVTKAHITQVHWKELRLDSLGESDFVYLDPPYCKADVRAYDGTNFDYPAMIDMLKKARFRWMLSEYPKDSYLRAFGEPYTRDMQLATDGGRGRRRRIECVWKNF